MVFIIVPLVLGALALFIRYTRIGIAIRAVAERSDRAATLGVPVGRIQTTVWVITAVLAFITVFLRAGVSSFPIGSALAVTVLVRALAAVVLGRMDDFPRIAAAAIGLGIVEQAIVFDTGRDLYVFPVLFVIVVVGLLLEPRGTGQPGRRPSRVVLAGRSRGAAHPHRAPVDPRRALGRPPCPSPSSSLFVLTLPLWLSDSKLLIATVTGIIAIVAVSLVLLTGLGRPRQPRSDGVRGGRGRRGRVGHPERRAGISASRSWPAGLAGAVLAAVVGIPAARAGGLTLAVTTLALAPAVAVLAAQPGVLRLGAARALRHRPHACSAPSRSSPR